MDRMTTKHTHRMVFGRREAGCPRCEELSAGSEPIRWARKSQKQVEARRAAIRAHDCKRAGCGPVCTFGDW